LFEPNEFPDEEMETSAHPRNCSCGPHPLQQLLLLSQSQLLALKQKDKYIAESLVKFLSISCYAS
jgi:hypothetical protein